MKKQSVAIIAVVALVLAVAVGYALFSETITINGSATAKGSLDIQFTDVAASADEGLVAEGYTATGEGAIAEISADGKTLTINVNKLDYPGSYVEIPVTVTNMGSIPAVLESLTETGLPAATPLIVTYEELEALEGSQIDPNGTQSFKVKVAWDSTDELEDTNVTAKFTIGLNYKQIAVQ